MYLPTIRRFAIIGLHYYQDFRMVFDNKPKILVGENGIGKTTILSSLYYLLAQNWHYLLGNAFDFIELEIDGLKFDFSYEELNEAYGLNRLELDNLAKDNKFYKLVVALSKINTDQLVYFPAFRNLQDDFKDAIGNFDFAYKASLKAWALQNKSDKIALHSIEKVVSSNLLSRTMNDVNDRLALSSAQARQQFTDICNKYLYTTEWHLKGESKIPVVRNKYNNDPVQLLDLSSGERQIIHILSRIYLSAIGNLLVFFDEPEISLSIPWQQTILPDVLSSSNCAFLLAVTHSPFVFKNELDVYATGLSMHTTFRNGK